MMNKKQLVFNFALWVAYFLALLASISHVAYAFNTLERANDLWAGWLAAISVDVGLAALAYAIQQRKKVKRSTLPLWLGVLLFAGISGYSNVIHAWDVNNKSLFHAIILSATLPLLVLYLGEVISSDDVALAEQKEQERKQMMLLQEQAQKLKEQQLAKEQARADRLDARILVEKQAKELVEQKLADVLASQSALKQFPCPHCMLSFAKQAQLSGHMKKHSKDIVSTSKI